ncbi:hypothetical protein FACS189454_05870 [Planctomycetales bacterium]|nr:hypothetical protein FACS189454_05870 [Planctomycetales bacterium]
MSADPTVAYQNSEPYYGCPVLDKSNAVVVPAVLRQRSCIKSGTQTANLGKANVPLKTAQILARHSTVELTANIYTQQSQTGRNIRRTMWKWRIFTGNPAFETETFFGVKKL